MRYLIVSDIHANLTAFEAVLQAAEAAGGFDEIWCLGDVVGYGPDPNECLTRLQAYPHRAVIGNHDLAAIGQIDLARFNPDAAAAARWTRRELTPEHHAYLEGLPERFEQDNFTIVHGSPRAPTWEYLLSIEDAASCFEHFQTPFCLVGHTHIPVLFLLAGDRALPEVQSVPKELRLDPERERFILNPGGVGQPRNGDPRAACARIDDTVGTLTHLRVPYDVRKTQHRMIDAGLPWRLTERLSFGM